MIEIMIPRVYSRLHRSMISFAERGFSRRRDGICKSIIASNALSLAVPAIKL